MATERTVITRLKAEVGDFVRGMAEAGAAVEALDKNINKTNDRTAWLAQGLLALAPAVVPLGAAAVPVMTGIATQATVAAGAVGTMALAFKGIGAGLKALQTYETTPTAANLEKVNEAMQKLGPDGAHFVFFLDQAAAKLRDLQNVARAGMFPGFEQGITSLLARLPEVRGIIQQFATGLGQLVAEGGASLGSKSWDDFFRFLHNNAQPILLDMGRTIGNVVHGFANMLVAFAPLSREFSGGLLNMSRSFATWAANLDQTKGFEDFVNYVHQAGPEALKFLGALTNALVELAKGFAPVGELSLKGLTDLLNLIAQVADTPIGHLTLMAAMLTSVWGRLGAMRELTGSGVFSLYTKDITAATKASGLFARAALTGNTALIEQAKASQTVAISQAEANRAFASGVPSLRDFGRALTAAAIGQTELSKLAQSSFTAGTGIGSPTWALRLASSSERVATFGSRLTSAAKAIRPAVGQIGMFAVAMSPLPEKLHLTNTAMGAMVGSAFGPWGTAAGAVVGAFKDMTDYAGRYNETLRTNADIMRASSSSFEDFAKAAQSNAGVYAAMRQDAQSVTGFGDAVGSAMTAWDELGHRIGIFGGNGPIEQAAKMSDDARKKMTALSFTFDELTHKWSGGKVDLFGGGQLAGYDDWSKLTTSQMTKVAAEAQSAQPILAKWGYTWDSWATHINSLDTAGASAEIDRLAAAVKRADSDKGRLDDYKQALAALDDQAINTADSAGHLADALSALLDPKIDLSAKTDAWITAIRHLGDDLGKTKTLIGVTDDAIKNRAAIRDRVSAMKDLLVSEAQAGQGTEKLRKSFDQQRASLVEQAHRLGINSGQLAHYLRALGFTPKFVKTTFEAAGLAIVTKHTKELRAQFNSLPKDLRIRIQQIGLPQTMANARALARQLNLVGAPRKAFLALAAAGVKSGITDIDKLLGNVDKKKTNPKITVNNTQANAAINSTTALLNALNGKTAVTYIQTVHKKATGGPITGPVRGPGSKTSDSIPARLSAGEYVVRAAAVDKYGVGFMHDVNAMRFADGGYAQRGYADIANRRTFEYQRPRASNVNVRTHVDLGDVRLTGKLDTPFGPAHVEGIARAVARDEIDQDNSFRQAQG